MKRFLEEKEPAETEKGLPQREEEGRKERGERGLRGRRKKKSKI